MIEDLAEAAGGEFVAIDVEGDGHNPPHPVEIAAILYRGGVAAEERRWLINPGRPMTEFVQELHGITDAMLADAPHFAEVEEEVRSAITGRVLVAHAAKEDLRMLRTAMPDADFLPAAVIDTQRLAKAMVPGLPRYRLEAVCEALGISPEDGEGRWGFHSAPGDAAMAGLSFMKLAAMIPPSPKQRRHVAGMAQIRMSPQEEQRLREEMAARTGSDGVFRP